MLRVLVVIGVALAIAMPSRADACQCDEGPAQPLPSSGVVPPNPTVLVFVPHEYAALDFDGGRIGGAESSITSRIAHTPSYDVWRHDVMQSEGTFSLHLHGYDYTYTIGKVAPNEVRIVGVEQNGQLTVPQGCGRHVAMDLEMTGNAQALRFAWDDGSSTIVPVYFSPYSQTSSASLGLLGCDEGRWNDEHLAELRRFSLYALFADGSEHKLGSSMTRLGPGGSRIPLELNGARIAPPAVIVPPAPAILEVAPPWRQGLAAAIGASLAMLVAGALRRRRREHRPRSS